MSKTQKAIIVGASIGVIAAATAAKAPKKSPAKAAPRRAPAEGYDEVQRDVYFDGPRGILLERELRSRID